jgi:DNA-binding NtrC family response regulator
MITPDSVIMVSRDTEIQRLLLRLLAARHAAMVTVTTAEAAEAIIVRQDLSRIELVIIDTAALIEDNRRQQATACQLLRDWTRMWPTLPLLFIGTSLQRHALLAIRADTVDFVAKPVTSGMLRSTLGRFIRRPMSPMKPTIPTVPGTGRDFMPGPRGWRRA